MVSEGGWYVTNVSKSGFISVSCVEIPTLKQAPDLNFSAVNFRIACTHILCSREAFFSYLKETLRFEEHDSVFNSSYRHTLNILLTQHLALHLKKQFLLLFEIVYKNIWRCRLTNGAGLNLKKKYENMVWFSVQYFPFTVRY